MRNFYNFTLTKWEYVYEIISDSLYMFTIPVNAFILIGDFKEIFLWEYLYE